MKKLSLPKFHWAKLLSVFFFILLLGAYANIFAIGQKYNPGETLDPACLPGEVNCTVDINGGTMIYPSTGIPISNGNAWSTSITDNSSNWNTAYGWGNHATVGYVTGTPWTTQGYITDGNTGWDNSYGFITSYTETDPIFLSSTAHGITGTDITNWNGKQTALTSGNNIKTINGSSILGAGDLTISGSSQWTTTGSDIYYNTGNVGIGMTNPIQLLTISGNTTDIEKQGFLSVDNQLVASLEGGMYLGRTKLTENPWESSDTGVNWTKSNSDGTGGWTSVAISSDGKIQSAVKDGSVGYTFIYNSTDYGKTWTVSNSIASTWKGIAMSSDGKIQSVVNDTTGYIYYSTNYGVDWTQSNSISTSWSSIAMSSDGKIQTAASDDGISGGSIYYSTDYGVNWTIANSLSRQWKSIAMSSDGKIQTALGTTGAGGYIYYSTDYGVNWIVSNSIANGWLGVAMSSDGKIQSAVSRLDYIYYSKNYGVDWTQSNSIVANWSSISISSDGKIQTAVDRSGYIHYSTNYGVDWTQSNSTSSIWSAIAMSSDGKIQSAVDNAGYIYYSNAKSSTNGNVGIVRGNLDLDNTTFGSQAGVITKNGVPFIHDFNYGNNGTLETAGFNMFLGANSGNFTMGSTATAVYESSYNLGIGNSTLNLNTTGYANTAIGNQALSSNTTGYLNLALGYEAGKFIYGGWTPNETSNNSIYLGSGTKASADGNTNEIVIGNLATGNGSNTVTIGNPSILQTYLSGINLKPGTDTAGTAPLKFTSGTNLGTAEAGAMEYDGTNLYFTPTGTTRKTIAYTTDLTSGYIPYTGGTSNVDLGIHNLTVDTNSLFVDATNHRVGIGKINPSYALDVTGSVNATAYYVGVMGFASLNTSDLYFRTSHDDALPTFHMRGKAGLTEVDGLTVVNSWVSSTLGSQKARATFNIFDTTNREAIRLESDGSSAHVGIGGAVDSNNLFTVNGQSYFNGNVGIGTPTPGTKLEIGSSDLGNGVAGPVITLGRNTNGTATGAGSINFLGKGGTSGYVWQDAAGNMRINTAAPGNANDTAGTVIGAQTSTRETKTEIMPYIDYSGALAMVTNAPLNTFRYIKEVEGYGTDSPLAKTRIGFIADEVDPMFMVGNSIDQVSVNGLLIASIKEMNLKVKELSSLDTTSANSLGSLIKQFIESEANRFEKIFAKTIVTDGIEMKDSSTGEYYCVVITNGEFNKIKGKCEQPEVSTPSTEVITPVEDTAPTVEIIPVTDLTTNDDSSVSLPVENPDTMPVIPPVENTNSDSSSGS